MITADEIQQQLERAVTLTAAAAVEVPRLLNSSESMTVHNLSGSLHRCLAHFAELVTAPG